MTKKLWSKSAVKLHPLIERYTVGDDYILDMTLIPYDIEGTRAHVKGLKQIGVLTATEERKLLSGLSKILKDYKVGKVKIRPQDEDCHTVIEQRLIKDLGTVGKKVHTGRSRNDQVLTALRLYMRDQLRELRSALVGLTGEFLKKAERNEEVPLPGYSHTQQAMLSSVGHYLASFVEGLLDDIDLLDSVSKLLNKSPLGTAAGFGVPLKLDRRGVARELEFEGLIVNSLYSQASRGKGDSLYLELHSQIMMTLGRFAADLIWFSSRELQFFTVKNNLLTGSSIMPQKKNYDAMEILRAQVGVVQGHQDTIQSISKGLYSGYNRDLQLMKKPLIESSQIVLDSVRVVELFVRSLKVQQKNILASIKSDIYAADNAIALSLKEDIPFRDAYRLVDMNDESAQDPRENIRAKKSLGSAGNLHLKGYQQRLKKLAS